jgi:hypothetical protein
MGWNYRVLRQERPLPGMDYVEVFYAVHEVYYREANDNHPHSWTKGAVSPKGETREELQDDLNRWLKAFSKPMLIIRTELNEDGIPVERILEATEPPLLDYEFSFDWTRAPQFPTAHGNYKLTAAKTPTPDSPTREETEPDPAA